MNLKNRSRIKLVTNSKYLPQIIFIAFVIGLLSPNSIKAQQDSSYTVHKLVERTQLMFQNYPIEKVHMHFDKPYYAVGDTIWFKAYLNTNLYDYEPSKLIYVEMLSERDSLIQTMRVPMKNRNGHGQIILNKDWFTTGNYRIRAYTKWMANFDQGYFFNKIIPVGDVLNNRLNTKVSFESLKSGRSSEKVRAKLQFTDRAGNVFGNKKVNWEAVHQFDVLEKGKGETDAMGNISFDINVKDKQRFLD